MNNFTTHYSHVMYVEFSQNLLHFSKTSDQPKIWTTKIESGFRHLDCYSVTLKIILDILSGWWEKKIREKFILKLVALQHFIWIKHIGREQEIEVFNMLELRWPTRTPCKMNDWVCKMTKFLKTLNLSWSFQ